MNTNEILTNADSISLDLAAFDQNKLCNLWQTVTEGFEILAGLIKNPIVKITILLPQATPLSENFATNRHPGFLSQQVVLCPCRY